MNGARVIALAGAGALALWLAWPDDATPVQDVPAALAQRAPPAAAAASGAGQPLAATGMAFFSTPPGTAAQPVPASISMAQTRLHGDPEAPPIAHDDERPVQASAQELADPKAYQAFEARQSERLYASYVQAVDKELPILRDDIARGRALGIAPDKIAKAEEKVRRLEAMRAQLLKDHPALGR